MNKQKFLGPLVIIMGLLSSSYLCVQEAKADPPPSTSGGRVIFTDPDKDSLYSFKVDYEFILLAHGGDNLIGSYGPLEGSPIFCNDLLCSSIPPLDMQIGSALLGDGDTSDGSSNPVPEIHGTRSYHYGTLKVSTLKPSDEFPGIYYRDWEISAYANIFPRCDADFDSCDQVSAVTNMSVKVISILDDPPVLVSITDKGLEAVPAPLPILGITAALRFSRRLRKLIKSCANPVSSSHTI